MRGNIGDRIKVIKEDLFTNAVKIGYIGTIIEILPFEEYVIKFDKLDYRQYAPFNYNNRSYVILDKPRYKNL